MAKAAFAAVVKRTGAAVAMTGQATTSLAANEYQITDTTKRILDPDTALSVIDNAVPQADADVTINYLFGKVKKVSGNFTGPVTVDASYLPTFTEAEARSFDINCAREQVESTDFDVSTKHRTRQPGLRDCTGSIGSLDNLLTDIDSGAGTVILHTDWAAGTRRVLEVTLGSTGNIFRAFVKFKDEKVTGAFEGIIESSYDWELDAATGTDQTEGSSFGFDSGGGGDGYN